MKFGGREGIRTPGLLVANTDCKVGWSGVGWEGVGRGGKFNELASL
jgi:hypothetical protein